MPLPYSTSGLFLHRMAFAFRTRHDRRARFRLPDEPFALQRLNLLAVAIEAYGLPGPGIHPRAVANAGRPPD